MANPTRPDHIFIAFQSAVAGRYSIDRELGRGGMGIVYLAHEVHLDRLVAIKLLPPERAEDPSLRERFLREARHAAKLSHPNIIPIHSVAESGEFVYYVMAFVDGETLAERVRTRGPLAGAEGARVLREVSWALAHAHSQGLVHRDVKPDNILLEAGSGRALVADFGIAAATAEPSQGVAGTPEFMSPEQASGVDVDSRTDIYSLGATAFYAFSGRLPFEGKTATEVLARHATEAPPTLASVGASVPRRIAALVDRCLSKDPERRPASADDVAEQLGLSLEQRRELPVALRAFVKRSSRMDGGGTLIATFGLSSSAVILSNLYGGEYGWATLIAGASLGPLGFMIGAARRLLRQGFSYADVAPAYQREREQISEELSVDRRGGPVLLERVLKWVAIPTMTTAGISALCGIGLGIGAKMSPDFWRVLQSSAAGPWLQLLFTVGVFSWGIGISTTLGYLALLQRRTDVDTGFWAKVWRGPLGRLAFSIAKRSGGKAVAPSAMTHRATELSLGLATEQLYESLPKDTRQALGDLPAVVRRLQDDAQALRRRHESLQEALSAASASSPEFDDLRQTRDDVHARLGEAVGTLETLRLGLLRLHAGSITVDGFTTHVDLAAEVSAQVGRLVSARDDLDATLSFPRPIAATPA
jgi:eukaryotic-like serine/threonine-protein kinase